MLFCWVLLSKRQNDKVNRIAHTPHTGLTGQLFTIKVIQFYTVNTEHRNPNKKKIIIIIFILIIMIRKIRN